MSRININNIITSNIKNLKFEIVDAPPLNKNVNTLYIKEDSKLLNTRNIMMGNQQINNVYLGFTKIWSSSENEEQTFDLLPIVMDSDSNLRLSFVDTYFTTGNSTFIMKPLSDKKVKLSNVNIEYLGGEEGSKNKVLIQKLDDFALLFERSNGYGKWPGGTADAGFSEQVNISLSNTNKTLTFKGRPDENNTTLLQGAYVSKVIKVPACGMTSTEKVLFYPYTFYDKYYSLKSMDTYLIDYNDLSNDRKNYYLWNNNEKVFYKNESIKTLNDTIFSSLNINYEYLEGTIEYSIPSNETNDFKETVIYTNQVLIHFIQEPHNDHRIYIRRDRRRALDTKYIENDDTGKFMFNLFESKILKNSIEINADIYDGSTGTYVLYPINLEYEYDIIPVGSCTLESKTYYWDNLEFKRYSCSKDSKIIFSKK